MVISAKISPIGTLVHHRIFPEVKYLWVHRPNIDLVPLLSEALWKLRMTQSHRNHQLLVYSTTLPTSFMGGLNRIVIYTGSWT